MTSIRRSLSICIWLSAAVLPYSKSQGRTISVNYYQDDTTQADQPSLVSGPVSINLLFRRKQSYINRLFMPIMKIGSKRVNIKTVFDTGSEGLILDAHSLLPSRMITDNGIFLNGQNSFFIDGITVTSIKDSASYGMTSGKGRKYFGQIAYSTITIGDQSGNLVTRKMPFLLIYRGINETTGKAASVDPSVDGIFGVSSSYSSNDDIASKRKQIKSPFAYLNYSQGINSGFQLDPLSTSDKSNIYSGDGVYTAPILKVGLTEEMELNYYQTKQGQRRNGNYFATISGEVVWGDNKIKTTILFDTGTPRGAKIVDRSISRSSVISTAEPVKFETVSGFNYDYIADSKQHITTLVPFKKTDRSVVGLNFFENNFFFSDYTNHTIGLK